MHNEDGSRTVVDSAQRKGFLARLARDVRGNTLAIVGAALVPLSAMIGSGVDMSRAYMAKTRLQSACDAAAPNQRQSCRHFRSASGPPRAFAAPQDRAFARLKLKRTEPRWLPDI